MTFSFETFQSIWQQQGKDKAFAYRDGFTTAKTDSKAPVSSPDVKEDISQAEEVIEAPTVEEKEVVEEKVEESDLVEFTRDDLIQKLTDAGIKFMPNSKDETLLKKCIENNLI